VGRVGRPHGLDGSFHVVAPEPGLFVAGLETSLGVVARVRGTEDRPIVSLAGVDTREAADALRGRALEAELELEEGEWWAEDLVGLRVVDGEREVGVVERVVAYPSCEVLVVGDLLVPLVDDAVPEVDLAGGVVHVSLEFLGAR
jgi:16S rRNA processing protein RimM